MTDTESTMSRIESTALDLFSTQGFAGTGIRQIATGSGISLASIYHHVASKEHLLYEIQRRCLTQLRDRAEQVERSAPSPLERLDGLIRQHVRMHITERKLCLVTDEELWALPTDMHEQIVELRDSYEAFWRRCLRDGQADGTMRITAPSLTRLALLDLCTGPARWYRPDGSQTVDELVESYARMGITLARGDAGHNNQP
ncbi:TetR/AcrR family transcriptional regulator [Microbacterium sp. A93]|uniref:TetR/AcrR family transcriptional regulator n=1 Tax=Microbacterium sp. A93 TaxID=3450716 RepID=UPI003F434B1B